MTSRTLITYALLGMILGFILLDHAEWNQMAEAPKRISRQPQSPATNVPPRFLLISSSAPSFSPIFARGPSNAVVTSEEKEANTCAVRKEKGRMTCSWSIHCCRCLSCDCHHRGRSLSPLSPSTLVPSIEKQQRHPVMV